MTRSGFIRSLGLLALAPAIIPRVLAHQPPAKPIWVFSCTTRAQAERVARWFRQCGHTGNPAWVYYDLVQRSSIS